MPTTASPGAVRIDKFLWVARFFKTRSLAAEEIGKGRVKVNGVVAKASREVKVGDALELLIGGSIRSLTLRAISHQRGPAPVAQALYEETPQSLAARAAAQEQRRLSPEPALTLTDGRPTKRQRRSLDEASGRSARSVPAWDQRWSASVDD